MAKNLERDSEVAKPDDSESVSDGLHAHRKASDESDNNGTSDIGSAEEDSAQIAVEATNRELRPATVPEESISAVFVLAVLAMGALTALLATELERVAEWAGQLGAAFVFNTLTACVAAMAVSFALARTRIARKAPRTLFASVGAVIGLALLGVFSLTIGALEEYRGDQAQLEERVLEALEEARVKHLTNIALSAEAEALLAGVRKELDLRATDLKGEQDQVAVLQSQLATLEERFAEEEAESVGEAGGWEELVAMLEAENARFREEREERSLASAGREEAGREDGSSAVSEDARNDLDAYSEGTQVTNIETETGASPSVPVRSDTASDSLEPASVSGGETVSSEVTADDSAGEAVTPVTGVTMPQLESMPRPRYPPAASRLQKQATVVVDVLVGETGKVLDATVRDPVGFGFDEAALSAARQASFKPGTKDGVPLKMTVSLTLRFVDRRE